MKKNKFMRIASVLLIVTLLSTSVISGTFAKYTTSATGSDSATVAKWGVKITANGTTFAKQYATDDSSVASTIANSVVRAGSNLIAPGTKGNMVKMTLTGTPEVAVKVSYEATITLENWVSDDSNTYYCPLEIKIGDDTLKGSSYTSTTDFANAIKEKVAAYSANYSAGTDLSNTTVKTPEISWSWPFSTDGNDAKDTYLGDAENAASISISVKTTVTQID